MKLEELKRRAREYVELEARTDVLSVRFERRYRMLGREDVVLRVRTRDREDPNWWVIGGGTPMNLYSARTFPDSDVAYSLHQGLVIRVAAQDFVRSKRAPDVVGYDAFISHATEDKQAVVKPLARALSRRGFTVWYDEFQLSVGDNLRHSIDRGLANSRFGIVILSKRFFSKKWPKYELDGLTAREIDGEKVILPVWHGVTRAHVIKFSPSLADRVALDTSKMNISRIAAELGKVLES